MQSKSMITYTCSSVIWIWMKLIQQYDILLRGFTEQIQLQVHNHAHNHNIIQNYITQHWHHNMHTQFVNKTYMLHALIYNIITEKHSHSQNRYNLHANTTHNINKTLYIIRMMESDGFTVIHKIITLKHIMITYMCSSIIWIWSSCSNTTYCYLDS